MKADCCQNARAYVCARACVCVRVRPRAFFTSDNGKILVHISVVAHIDHIFIFC